MKFVFLIVFLWHAGIVDRNSLKGVTLRKANGLSIKTARLPIRENVLLSSSQVLTVNHVYSILKSFSELSCWKTAIESVLPGRKASAKDGVESLLEEQEKHEESCVTSELLG